MDKEPKPIEAESSLNSEPAQTEKMVDKVAIDGSPSSGDSELDSHDEVSMVTSKPEETVSEKQAIKVDVVKSSDVPAGSKSENDVVTDGEASEISAKLVVDDDSLQPEREEFAKLLDASSGISHASEVVIGDKISGVVSKIGSENSFVDFGGRSEGMIKTSELKKGDGSAMFNAGDPVEAFVISAADEIVLSRFLQKDQRQADLLYQAYKSGMPVEGKVTAANKWGLGVEVQGVRAFCPISQIEVKYVGNTENYRGQTMQFQIMRFRDHGRNIVLSRRALIQADADKEAVKVRQLIVAGARLTGKVTRLEAFGVFVDLGSAVEGLIHVSELCHERVVHPNEVVEEGAEVNVEVLEVKHLGHRKKERISLSIKALAEDPWDHVRKQFKKADILQGTIDSIEDYGAFVALAPNVRGMVHVSELSNRHVGHPRDVVTVGDSVKVAVLEIDSRRRRLRLSMKQAERIEADSNLQEFHKRQAEDEDQASSNALADALKRAGLG